MEQIIRVPQSFGAGAKPTRARPGFLGYQFPPSTVTRLGNTIRESCWKGKVGRVTLPVGG